MNDSRLTFSVPNCRENYLGMSVSLESQNQDIPLIPILFPPLPSCTLGHTTGHSINAPTGRWQNRKDIHWYARDKTDNDEGEKDRKRREEIKRQKELEENALSIALGYGPTIKDGEDADGEGTGANGIKVEKTEKEIELDRLEAEEKKRKKECVHDFPKAIIRY
jgi:hypothetical protein